MRTFLHFQVSYFSRPWVWITFVSAGIFLRLFIFFAAWFNWRGNFLHSVLSTKRGLFVEQGYSLISLPSLASFFSSQSWWGQPEGWLSFLLFASSLFFLVGIFYLANNVCLQKASAYLALAIAAVHFSLPFIFLQSAGLQFSMSLLPWGFYFLTKLGAKSRDYFWASLFLSLASFFYLPAFIFWLVSFFYILWELRRKRRTSAHFIFYLAAFLFCVMIFVVLNFFLPHSLLQKPNLLFLPSAWLPSFFQWIYLFLLVIFFIPPFSFFLLPALWKGMQALPLLSLNFWAFFIAHTFWASGGQIFFIPLIFLFIVLTLRGMQDFSSLGWVNAGMATFFLANTVFIFAYFFR